MKIKSVKLSLFFAFHMIFTVCPGQVVLSEKTVFHIDNVTIKVPEIKLKEQLPLSVESDVIKIIGQLRYSDGKQKIIVNNVPAVLYGDTVFFADLTLAPGPNKIKIDLLTGNEVVNRYTYDVFRVVKNPVNIANGKFYALVIGINKYSDPLISELDYCVRDARNFYDAITSRYLFNKDDVRFLENATSEQIVESLDYFTTRITPADNFLIFYAGHGIWETQAETGYWLPSDVSKNSKFKWFRNSTLRDYLRSINSKHTLVISDACFGGSIFKTRAAFSDAPLAINKLYDLRSRKAMTSGTLTEVPDQSAFIKYLLERLNNNNEKYLSSEQLFSSFRIAVINNSSAVPQFGEIREVGDEGGDFIFILKDNTSDLIQTP